MEGRREKAKDKCRVEWRCKCGDWTMQRTGLALLALLLASCSELVVALQCFTCHETSSLSSCVTITTCNATETMCKATVHTLETGDATVTMSCTSECVPWDVDSFGQTWPVFCCDTDLCNVDGAPTLGSLHGLALTLALTSLLSLQL
ncbi:ly6/PLAUR domain-containing protein 2 isoform X3 [Rhinolophus sinicus]|uniref:ly6/PLAUR domain-containing protein 2 isoform X3 n=1 Tax=Rhinolophus sinicus TaxID=89399 RepID=UPI000943B1E8|nr:PREDICTED: ly6/PLAUR domain-containing protein 2-like isoform X2 [Rhinolophus sinicus]